MSENKYHPFSEEDYIKLKEKLNSITTFLPEGEMDYIWHMVSVLRGKHTARPCSCRSSAKHWTSAIEDLRNFVKGKESEQ